MDDIYARREARRRKILENSERRLKKISGVEQKTTKTEIDDIKFNASYRNETESSSPISNNIADNLVSKLDGISTLQNSVSCSSSSEVQTIFKNPNSVENDSVSTCQVDITTRKSYRNLAIFILPVILSFVLVMFDLFRTDVEFLYLNRIFIPLLAYEIVEYVFSPYTNVSPNFLTSLILLSNIRNNFLTAYIEYIQYFLRIMQDVMVYFFVFILSHSFFKVMLL